VCSIDELLSFGEKTRIAAQKAYKIYETGEYTEQDVVSTYDGCRWCKHKHECAALQAMALDDVGEVPTPDRLGLLFDKIDMVKLWADSIVEAVTNAVKSGQTVVGADGPYKLVAGRRGHRKWIDESQVESIMKSMRLKADEIYNKTLISPTTAEKLLKDKPQSWVKLSPLYTQSESSPVVAKATDKRPAIEVEPDFGPVEDS
jgi:hypothetical protein